MTSAGRFAGVVLTAGVLVLPSFASGGDFLPLLGEDIHQLFSLRTMCVIGAGGAAASVAFLTEDPEGDPGFLGTGIGNDISEICHHSMGLPLLGASALVWGAGAAAGHRGLAGPDLFGARVKPRVFTLSPNVPFRHDTAQ